jgi:5-methylcytosine-specific restriction endonuclease McrA
MRIHGPEQWGKLYDRQLWRGPHGLRKAVLARDPVCMICHRNPATVADHKIPHRGNWNLFTDLAHNLWGICETCHSRKTAMEDGGFSHPIQPKKENTGPQATGSSGKQFSSSGITVKKLDAALDFDVESLLKDIPQ